jgi:hypothetical protein
MRSEAAALQRAGLQLLGLFVDVLGAAARQYVDKVCPCGHQAAGEPMGAVFGNFSTGIKASFRSFEEFQ